MAASNYVKKTTTPPPPPQTYSTPPPPKKPASAGTGGGIVSGGPVLPVTTGSGDVTGGGRYVSPGSSKPWYNKFLGMDGSGSSNQDSGLPGVGFDWGSMPDFAATDPAKAQSDMAWGVISGILSGKDKPFGDAEVNSEKAQAKTASENAYNQAADQIQSQQAATGFASSPVAERPLLAARIGASQQYGKASNEILINAAQQNFNAKLSAIQSAQQWVDGLRGYVATMTGSWYQREQAKAQLALAEANLAEQQREFNLNFASNNAG